MAYISFATTFSRGLYQVKLPPKPGDVKNLSRGLCYDAKKQYLFPKVHSFPKRQLLHEVNDPVKFRHISFPVFPWQVIYTHQWKRAIHMHKCYYSYQTGFRSCFHPGGQGSGKDSIGSEVKVVPLSSAQLVKYLLGYLWPKVYQFSMFLNICTVHKFTYICCSPMLWFA